MGLTTALFTGLSGLTTNSEAISVTGNNIANLNTTGFKASRVTFETQILSNLAAASGPSSELGGTNPIQVGQGTRIGAITRNFNDGSIAPTGVATDMAIEGDGFFVLSAEGAQRFTRAGNFQLDRDFNLVNPDGGRLQGYGIDADFNITQDGGLVDLHVPVGMLTLAEATKSVALVGNLNTNGDVAVNGSKLRSETLFDQGLNRVADPAISLTELRSVSVVSMFSTGDIITVTGVTKGGATLPDRTFEVGLGNTSGSDAHGQTLQDLMSFLNNVLGIDNSISGGVELDPENGWILVEGNTGELNDIVIDSGNILVNELTNLTEPMRFHQNRAADGESVRTTFVAYDSLGAPMQVDVSIVLEAKANTGTTWRYYAQSKDDTDAARMLGSGLLEFDTNGSFVSVSDPSFSIDRDDTGAFSPQQISLAFSSPEGSLSALADSSSQVTAMRQDGSPVGTLQDFSVSENGTIVGVFSNGLLRDLGRVTLAKFANPVGLVEEGANIFAVSANSGMPAIGEPGTGGTGRIIGESLELSNTELSNEFINLINYSTGFSASSRVLTTSDRLIQELLATVR